MPLELDVEVLLDADVVELAPPDDDVLDDDVLVEVVATEDDVAEESPLLAAVLVDGPGPEVLVLVTPVPPAPPVPGPTGTTPVAHALATTMPATSTAASTLPQSKRRSLVAFMAPLSVEADIVNPEIERRRRVHDELDAQERREIQ